MGGEDKDMSHFHADYCDNQVKYEELRHPIWVLTMIVGGPNRKKCSEKI